MPNSQLATCSFIEIVQLSYTEVTPEVVTSVNDSTVVDPKLLVSVNAITRVSAPLPLAPPSPSAPAGKAVMPAPGRQVGMLNVTTD